MGNILALQLSDPQPQQLDPLTQIPVDDGYRALLAVDSIVAYVQTTRLYGNNLFMLSYDIGSLSQQQRFTLWVQAYSNRPMTWGQLAQLPFSSTPGLLRHLMQLPDRLPPDAEGTITAIGGGYDVMRGYYVDFQGNYFLTFPIFKNWPSVKTINE